ncbi:Retrovirus-related Pol polyprotein from transposon TNT 1-94 [Senna tora]|uniref:Retrovirus-related Pol polyprotein from transposon TNT 1-94 n=1 Tax=Senna tora TaxID=362788 RepID=A0A834U113_9FABA|nr:Retrovirus-related Pol polyprotein from transposon TNT 1-94 [Senna tora]
MGQLFEKGYDMRVHQGFCTLFDKNRIVAKVKMSHNRLFPFKIQRSKFSCLNYVIPDENWFWNLRVGHFHFSGLNNLSRKRLVSGLPVVNIPYCVCETFVMGKKHRETLQVGKLWRKLPKEFWAEAIACVVNILNRCPLKSVHDKTLEEAWSRRRPSIRHLKVFGCIAYARVPYQLRKKLDDKR